jgi:hypothetical protein
MYFPNRPKRKKWMDSFPELRVLNSTSGYQTLPTNSSNQFNTRFWLDVVLRIGRQHFSECAWAYRYDDVTKQRVVNVNRVVFGESINDLNT